MSSDAAYLDRIIGGALPAILIAGRDAHGFAQAQFTGDVDHLAPGGWQWNAWLDAKGRVLALMWLADLGEGRLLVVPRGGDPASMLATLQRYVLRRDVVLSARSFSASWGPPLPLGRCVRGDGIPTLGLGARSLRLAAPSANPADPDAVNAWRLEEIRSGWPVLPASGPAFLPPALGLARLGAVSFAKGCYPGQEIAARLHYRGGHKLRLYRVRGSAPWPAPAGAMVESTRATLLVTATDGRGTEALIVAPVSTDREINVLHNVYEIESTFDA